MGRILPAWDKGAAKGSSLAFSVIMWALCEALLNHKQFCNGLHLPHGEYKLLVLY